MKDHLTFNDLKGALNNLTKLAKQMRELEKSINEIYGVDIYGVSIATWMNGGSFIAEMHCHRGIEEIEKATGRDVTEAHGFSVEYRKLKYNNCVFFQAADAKTGVFVKAGKEPPKMQIVEE